MESFMTFGEWLRQRRSELRLTREAFAGRIGCSAALLRKIENGERRPSIQIARLLANSLNIPPAEQATFVKVARGELSVERLPAVLNSVDGSQPRRTNLPVLPTPLIGRRQEIRALDHLLHDPQCRLLTLVGPGGIGKTRLAIEAASSMQAAFADGAYFVPFDAVNTTRLILPVIADALGFVFSNASRADPKTQLFSYLKEKQVLLLADNLEQLLAEPGVEVLAELLENAPRVKLLVTSRESLGLQGEWVFEVQGLPVPESQYAEESVQGTSVELFLQRARRASVGFNATVEDYPAILRICQLVGGMPLGIDLAAAWVRTLSCAEIALEIETGLDFLSGPARDIPARHRSMRAVFDHSWKLLQAEEQDVLLQLSVFQGGFRREAAEVIAGAKLSTLSSLVTKSLIRRSGTGRYDLHEVIHQFAAERFGQSLEEQAAAQARHSHYYLTFFSQEDERLRSAAQREALAELTAEIGNIRAAWDWAVAQGAFDLIEQTLRVFVMLYDTRGWLQDGLDMLDRAITALEASHAQTPPDRIDQVALAHLLTARSVLASRLGEHETAQVMLERSLEILRPLDAPRVLVEVVTFLGTVMEATGNHVRALELYSEGLAIATKIGDRWFATLCHSCIIDQTTLVQGIVRPEDTHEGLLSVVQEWRDIGDPRFTALGLNLLGWNALALGWYAEARAALEESVALSTSIGDRWGLGFAYRGLGIIYQEQGEHRQAIEIFQKSLDTLTDLGARQDVARVLTEMGRSIFALGKDDEARRYWHESLSVAFETRGMFIVMETLTDLASLLAKRGNVDDALELLLFVLEHPASVQATRDRAARQRAELEAQLTSQQVEAARARAQTKTIESIVAEILKQL